MSTENPEQAATRAHEALTDAGGIVGAADIAERWEISRARARHLVKADGFPAPAGHVNAYPYWLAAEVDRWRSTRPVTGRPRKTSTSQP